jgi:hypothetical protein
VARRRAVVRAAAARVAALQAQALAPRRRSPTPHAETACLWMRGAHATEWRLPRGGSTAGLGAPPYSNRISSNRSLCFRETEFCAQRQRRRNIERNPQKSRPADHRCAVLSSVCYCRVFATVSFNARSRQSISRSSLNGFFRKREAAVLNAFAPESSADRALIKMIGLR